MMAETEEKQRLELKLIGADRRHEEQRAREIGGARAQLGRLQQRCREAEEAQAGLQESCARELGAVETAEHRAVERHQAMELQEELQGQELSKLTLARDSSQA